MKSLLGSLSRWLGGLAGLRSYYGAATKDRLNENWRADRIQPNRALVADAATLRARTVSLFRDNPIVRAIINAQVNSTVPTPIDPRPDITGGNKAEVDRFSAEILALWKRYSASPEAFSLDGRTNFSAMLRTAARLLYLNGEAFVVRHGRNQADASLPPLRFELVESDQLADSTPFAFAGLRSGVKFDADGRPLSYEFKQNVAGLVTSLSTVTVPASRVAHFMVQLYPGQNVGEPAAAPIGEMVYAFGSYFLSEVQSAETTARIFGILKTNEDPYQANTEDDSDGRSVTDLGYGELLKLYPGEEAMQFPQTRPGNGFAPFTERTLKILSAAAGLPYEIISGDYSGVNFSTSQMANLVAEDSVRPYREVLRDSAVAYIWREFVREAVLSGLVVPIAGLTLEQHTACRYSLPALKTVNPKDQAEADVKEMQAGLSTYQEILSRHGKDRDQVLRQIAEDRAAIKAAGLDIDPYGTLDAWPATGPAPIPPKAEAVA